MWISVASLFNKHDQWRWDIHDTAHSSCPIYGDQVTYRASILRVLQHPHDAEPCSV
jgi:hypothetical protein